MKFQKALAPKVGKKHTHIVYMNEMTQTYEVAESNGHRHEITIAEDGSVILNPDPVDGHFHETLAEMNDKFPKRPESEDSEVVHRTYKLAQAAWEYEKKSLKNAQESNKFYKGDQWGDQKEQLEGEGRAALTINLIQKFIDDLIGYQRQQRSDLKCLPVGESADQKLCDITNILLKVLVDQNKFEFEESTAFEDQVVTGRGFFGLHISQRDDIRGDLKIESYPSDQIVMGPHLKIDASDCEYLVKAQRWSVDKLKAKYKDKANEIHDSYKNIELEMMKHGDSELQYAGDNYSQGSFKIPVFMGDHVVYNKARKEILVVELEEKIYIPVSVIYDSQSEDALSTFGWSASDLKQVLTIPNIYVVDQEVQKMRITRCAGGTLLSDEYVADLPVDDFTIIPVYGKKRGHDFWGKVESAKDPQKEFNKRISQSIDVVNFASLYGFFYDEGTFISPGDENSFKNTANRPGFVQKVSSTQSLPVLIQGVKFPGEMMSIADASENRLEKMISVEATRFAGANTSANAIMQAEKSALVGNEFLFRNMKAAKKKLGEMMIKYAQKYYSPQRIYRLLSQQNTKAPFQVGQQSFDKYTEQDIIAFLQDKDMTKVDITVDETNWSPTQRIATLNILMDLSSKGFPIPPEGIIPFMDLPEDYKQQFQQAIMSQQQSQASAASSSQESEIQKSLIGQGLFPPKVLEQQGLNPDGSPLQQPQSLPQGPLPPGAQGNSNPPIDPNMLLQGGGM